MSCDEQSADPILFVVESQHVNKRLDVFLAERLPQFSRAYLRKALDAGSATLNGKSVKPSTRLRAGDQVSFLLPDLPSEGPEPEEIPLDILYEDEQIAAINKPPGMVVHPAKGHWAGTLASAISFHFQNLSTHGGQTRPGIVHRLDRDTSGVIVIAKNDEAHVALSQQFQDRTTEKEYYALVLRTPELDSDVIRQPIGPHPTHREKMAIRSDHPSSREAITEYHVQQRFAGFASVKLFPKTGRTHQLRVHLASIGTPVLCDKLYGGRDQLLLSELSNRPEEEQTVLLDRQALHARRLRIAHPRTKKPLEFVAPVPADIEATEQALRTYRAK